MFKTLYRTYLAVSRKTRLERAEKKIHSFAVKRQALKLKALEAQKKYEGILKEL